MGEKEKYYNFSHRLNQIGAKIHSIGDFININNKHIIYFCFLLIYLTVGLYISFFNDLIIEKWNLIFDADCPRVYKDFFCVDADHYRVKVHPFLLMLLQPIFHLISGIVVSPRFTLILVNSLIMSTTVLLIRDIIIKLTNNNKVSVFISIIYGISFSCLIFASIPETYMFSTLFMLLLINLILDIKIKQKISGKEIIYIALLGLSSFGITPASIIPIFFVIIYLLSSLYTDRRIILNNFLKIISAMFVLYLLFSGAQKLAYPNSPVFFQKVIEEDERYINYDVSFKKIYNIATGMYIEPFYALNISKENRPNRRNGVLVFSNNNQLYKYIPILFLFIFPTFCMLFKKQYNKELLFISSILIYYMICHYFYGNGHEFLYSQNFLMFIVVLLGLLYSCCSSKVTNYLLPLFIIFQTITNIIEIEHIQQFTKFNAVKHYNLGVWILYSLITVTIILFIYIVAKRLINKFVIDIRFEHVIWAYYTFIFVSLIFTALFQGRL